MKTPSASEVTPAVVPAASNRRRKSDLQTKALAFLRGVGNNPDARAALESRGYTDEEHFLGWSYVFKVGSHRTAAGRDESPADALGNISAWMEPTLKCTKAALQHPFPDQAAFVLDGLGSTTGAECLVTARTFLDRLDALEKSPERKSTRKADHDALALLAKRKITEQDRALMRAQLAIATTPAEATPIVPANGDTYAKDVENLQAWYDDWSLTAHAVIQRRDLLIRLGLAKRIRRKPDAPPATTPPPPAIAPAAPVPQLPVATTTPSVEEKKSGSHAA